MSGDRWETGHDFFQDLDYLSEFHNDSNDSLVLEINQNGVLQIDEDSDESHEHGPEHVVQETLSTEIPSQSGYKIMDQLLEENTRDLRQYRLIHDEEAAIRALRNTNAHQSSDDSRGESSYSAESSVCSIASSSADSAGSVNSETVIPKKNKSKRSKFRPLPREPSGFISNNESHWSPLEAEKPLSVHDFPSLKK